MAVFVCFGSFLPSEMIINIIGDDYGSILICNFVVFFVFLHFLPVLAFLGISCIFGVSVGFWECYWVISRAQRVPATRIELVIVCATQTLLDFFCVKNYRVVSIHIVE